MYPILLLSMLALGAHARATFLEGRGPPGINNQGSHFCPGLDSVPKPLLDIRHDILNGDIDSRQYTNGVHIACLAFADIGGLCAFLQKTSTPVSGKQIKELITLLANHPDTPACGSVPVSLLPEFGGVNELSKMGMLTVNYVANTRGCNGLC